MANTRRGEVNLQGHTLCFDTNAMCTLEEVLQVDSIQALAEKLAAKPSLRMLRQIVHVGLQRHDAELTLEQAGDVISDVGLSAATEAVVAAMNAIAGDAGKPARPRVAAVSTGKAS
jgi:hypothetical protein